MAIYSFQKTIFLFWCTLVSKIYGQDAADWMSGNHGVGFRLSGGVSIETALYDVNALVKQIKDEIPQITWILIGISSGAFGDRYNSPHSILTDLNRACTPKQTENVPGLPNFLTINANGLTDFDLEEYPERDLISEIASAFQAEGFRVIAYMAAQGPSLMKHGEKRAYDYNGKSLYVNSIDECITLTSGAITDGKCSPSVRRWKNKVIEIYGNDTDSTLQIAYAKLILGEYVNKFDGKDGRALIDGWWFDQGKYMNIPLAHEIIMESNPNAIVAFNYGQKIPLRNNNAPYEDFTGGHPNPITRTLPTDLINLPIIESIEQTSDGYFDSGESRSLGHVFQMTNEKWNSGDLAWGGTNIPRAIDWMSRVVNAKGAFTWNVKRSFFPYVLHPDDIALLKQIYAGLNTTSPTKSPTSSPTTSPTKLPSSSPNTHPIKSPTSSPTTSPTKLPASSPTTSPTKSPSSSPITSPTKSPTLSPTTSPTESPTSSPTTSPTKSPTPSPITRPTKSPTSSPTTSPTKSPTLYPTTSPTKSPTSSPTTSPTKSPTLSPTTSPTKSPTLSPTTSPIKSPTSSPTTNPTKSPTPSPTTSPTKSPTLSPTTSPTNSPTSSPTTSPTNSPTSSPTTSPIKSPTPSPTSSPTKSPTSSPTTSSTTIAPSFSQFCTQDSDDQFISDIKEGVPRVKSCSWLSQKSKNKKNKICQRETSLGEYEKPADVCKLTCGIRCPSTDLPSLSPTVVCEEIPSAKFVLKLNPSGPKTMTCFNLSLLLVSNMKRGKRICKSGLGFGDIGSAADVCPNSCQSCRSIETTIAPTVSCIEKSSDQFFLKIRSDTSANVKTCEWLVFTAKNKQKKICERTDRYQGFKPAREICRKTCDTCLNM